MARRGSEKELREKIRQGLLADSLLAQAGVDTGKQGKKRGRPKGYRVSAETKAKISATRRMKREIGEILPRASQEDVTPATIKAVFERDDGCCRGCKINYMIAKRTATGKPVLDKNGNRLMRVNSVENIKVYTVVGAAESNDDPRVNALTCQFCRDSAKEMPVSEQLEVLRLPADV